MPSGDPEGFLHPAAKAESCSGAACVTLSMTRAEETADRRREKEGRTCSAFLT